MLLYTAVPGIAAECGRGCPQVGVGSSFWERELTAGRETCGLQLQRMVKHSSVKLLPPIESTEIHPCSRRVGLRYPPLELAVVVDDRVVTAVGLHDTAAAVLHSTRVVQMLWYLVLRIIYSQCKELPTLGVFVFKIQNDFSIFSFNF